MITSSSPCFFHSSRMYSASWLFRFEPATWGSCVKMRCCRRTSSGLGTDLDLDSLSVSRVADLAVKPEIDCAFAFEKRKRASAAPRSRVIAVAIVPQERKSTSPPCRRHHDKGVHPLVHVAIYPFYFAFRISVSRSGLDSSRTRWGYSSPSW